MRDYFYSTTSIKACCLWRKPTSVGERIW